MGKTPSTGRAGRPTTAAGWRLLVAVAALLSLLATACGGDDAADDTADTAAEEVDDAEDADDVEETEEADEAEETEEADEAEETEEEAAGGSEEAVASGDYCTDPPPVLESITVGINNPNYATQLAVVIADERGYFADVGITDVEIIETDEYIAGVLGGSMHIAQGDTDVVYGSALASGEDLRYLGTYRDSEYQILGVRAGIESGEDLIGLPVTGGDLEGRNTALMAKYLEALGISIDDVELVPMGGNSDARLQALVEGTVAAASLFPRHRVPLEESGGRFIYEELEENPQEGVVALGDFVDNECSTMIAYWQATLQARADMYDFDQQDEILELMRGRGFEIPDFFEAVYDLEVNQVSEDGGFDIDLMDALVAEQIGLENLPADIEWRDYVDLRPLHAAQTAEGIDLNPASL